jgi:hypothetical protein
MGLRKTELELFCSAPDGTAAQTPEDVNGNVDVKQTIHQGIDAGNDRPLLLRSTVAEKPHRGYGFIQEAKVERGKTLISNQGTGSIVVVRI